MPMVLRGLGLVAADARHWPDLMEDLDYFRICDRRMFEAAIAASTSSALNERECAHWDEVPLWLARGKLAMRMMRALPPEDPSTC